MLLRFGVENHKSIKGYQELNLTASNLTDESTDLIFHGNKNPPVLPAIAIYGANASGKSNILDALGFMRSCILQSHANESLDYCARRTPFLLDEECVQKISTFDCDFILDTTRYSFGFKIDKTSVIEEWLYAYPEGRRQIWYHRNIKDDPIFYFGNFLKGKNRTIEALTRSNSLFISVAAQNNHTQLTKIYQYFKDFFKYTLGFIGTNAANIELELDKYLEDENFRNFINTYLKLADTGIVDLGIREFSIPEEAKPMIEDLSALFKKHLKDDAPGFFDEDKRRIIVFRHRQTGNKKTDFSINNESSGTLALVNILGPIHYALSNGYILIIDELDSSLHPMLSRSLIKLFGSNKNNPKGAQIIFTTHDTNLLDSTLLRRDQIWFTEKDKNGTTHLYPLSDIRTRKGDNIEKGYLQGRYGAIPYLGSTDCL